MASVGKFVGSLISGRQEITAALANVNFDFSILKIEAPAEYAGLGSTLSKRRRIEAEDGASHITARRLGALFESELPDVPSLVSAYGRRVTEIAAQSSVNPKGRSSDGPFADHVGADGTTIWAAARSGRAAIAVHLLACMLARIWSQGEAISIWTELVNKRQAILRSREGDESSGLSAIFSPAHVQVTRDQLAEWDASARAWLRTADNAKATQQTQLRLISDNISLPVSTESGLYEPVMKSWVVAMSAMEDLISGKPQRIQSGALLLALSAWHLYPDMSVQSSVPRFVEQHDHLVSPRGIITIGLQNKPNHADQGVHWSLPLAHLRYYGRPVTTTRHAGIDQTQVSFDEFLCLAFGSLLSTWSISDSEVEIAAKVVSLLASLPSVPPWLRTLGRAADMFLASKDTERDQLSRLIAYGRRRCGSFLGAPEYHPLPVFGLTHIPTTFSLFTSATRTKEDPRVEVLRRWAQASHRKLAGAVIRYFPTNKPTDSLSKTHALYTNIVPTSSGKKRKKGQAENLSLQSYTHWSGFVGFHNDLNDNLKAANLDSPEPSEYLVWIPPSKGAEERQYVFVCGEPSKAAIFRPKKVKKQTAVERNGMSVKEFLVLLQTEGLHKASVPLLLKGLDYAKHGAYLDSLRALSGAEEIFRNLSDARVDVRTGLTSLDMSFYSRYLQVQPAKTPERTLITHKEHVSLLKAAFSCIALFQTGHVDMDPANLEGAMAISHGDSIFVSQRLLLDPSAENPGCPVQRIVGNVGKPGLVVLVAPQAPEVRPHDAGSWNLVTHAQFDGKFEDSFSSTTLHLAFTGYELPVDVKERGSRDHEVFLVETLISVYDRGVWIADLDILKGLEQYRYGWTDHSTKIPRTVRKPLISIDNWYELLDKPLSDGIVRAHKNAFARLAIVTVAAQCGFRFSIISADDDPPDLATQSRDNPVIPDAIMHKPVLSSRHHRKGDSDHDPAFLAAIADFDPGNIRYDFEEEEESDNSSSTESIHSVDIGELGTRKEEDDRDDDDRRDEDREMSDPNSEGSSDDSEDFDDDGQYHTGDIVLYIC